MRGCHVSGLDRPLGRCRFWVNPCDRRSERERHVEERTVLPHFSMLLMAQGAKAIARSIG